MKAQILWVAIASTLFGVGARVAHGQEVIANVPHTAASEQYADLLRRGSKAITTYVNACADKNWPLLQSTLTDDGIVEYQLIDPGMYLALDNAIIADYCNYAGATGHIASLWVFPAGGDTMLVSYTLAPRGAAAGAGGTDHLVQLTINGDRISHMRDFTANGESIKHAAALFNQAHGQ